MHNVSNCVMGYNICTKVKRKKKDNLQQMRLIIKADRYTVNNYTLAKAFIIYCDTILLKVANFYIFPTSMNSVIH